MTDTTTRLPDLLVRTTARGDRFGWRMIDLEGNRFLTSDEQSVADGSPADFESRDLARRAASAVLLEMIRAQPALEPRGDVVTLSPSSTPAGPARLVA